MLGSALVLPGCGSISDQIPVTEGPSGAVYLQQFFERGTTMRYGGPIKSFRASHPIDLSLETLAKALAGLRIGLTPSDGPASDHGIKPRPVFSPSEVAFLAPALAQALKQVQPDQRVKFHVGTAADATEGTLHVDGQAIQITLSHYHAQINRPDEQLSISILSFVPHEAQTMITSPQTWMEIEPNQPRVAVSLAALATLPTPSLLQPPTASTPMDPLPGNDSHILKQTLERQAQELDALKAELEALKKQMGRGRQP